MTSLPTARHEPGEYPAVRQLVLALERAFPRLRAAPFAIQAPRNCFGGAKKQSITL